MGTKNRPTGFGVWVAFEDTLHTIEHSIELCKAIGAQWVAPRGGAGRYRDSRWGSAEAKVSIQKYHDAGIRVYPWLYSMPSTCSVEVALFKAFMDEGADGVYIDAEVEWQGTGQNGPVAETFMKAMRAALGDDCFIGHAPFPYVLYHTQFPYVEFGRYCDQVATQLYWSEISDAGAKHHIDAVAAQWKSYLPAHPEASGGELTHIGVTYGHELPGVKNPPPGTFRGTDLKLFMDWCVTQGFSSYSVYSLDAMNSEAYATLKAIKDGTPIPPHVDVPKPTVTVTAPVILPIVAPEPVVVAPEPTPVAPAPVQQVEPPPQPTVVTRPLVVPTMPAGLGFFGIVFAVVRWIVAFIASRRK